VGDFLSDLGAQGNLVVANLVGMGREAEQASGAEDQGTGKTGQWLHDDSL
jgi:hypothetical protein